MNTVELRKHFDTLGMEVKDKVTGMRGVVTSLSFDLYGCVQVIVTPVIDKEGVLKTGVWFDIARLDITGKKPVMDVPNFEIGAVAKGLKGGAAKPLK